MPSKAKAGRMKERTFLEEARRQQIIGATIETIAAQGYAQTSLAVIAKALDISKSVISYHFGSKDELIKETLKTISTEPHAYIRAAVNEQVSAKEKLRTYVRASIEFVETHRAYSVAQVDLWGYFGSSAEKHDYNVISFDHCRRYLAQIILEGQSQGEFRAVPADVLASVIQGALGGMVLQWVLDSEAIDLAAYRQGMVEMIERHVWLEETR